MMKITICEDCPILNRDYELGCECNLDYDIDLYWSRKSDNSIVKDTSEMRSHQDDFDLRYASKNCELVEINSKEQRIIPLVIETEESEEGNEEG